MELGERLMDRYKIVVKPSIDEYDTSGSVDPAEAREIIQQARRDSGADDDGS